MKGGGMSLTVSQYTPVSAITMVTLVQVTISLSKEEAEGIAID